MGKSVTNVLRNDLQRSAGGMQLCVGLPGGSEAAIHAMADIYKEKDTQGIIQLDANNAFNTINRKILLYNINFVCPEIAISTTNCYSVPARLFVVGGVEILSCEGAHCDADISTCRSTSYVVCRLRW